MRRKYIPGEFEIVQFEIKSKTNDGWSIKANLNLLMEWWSGIFYDWRLEIKECKIQTYSTGAWFDKNNNNYSLRESLFKKLDIEHKKRLNKKDPNYNKKKHRFGINNSR